MVILFFSFFIHFVEMYTHALPFCVLCYMQKKIHERIYVFLTNGLFLGKRFAFRASEHDANWQEEGCVVPPTGPPNPKKLKKSKSKDESSQG